MSKRNKYVHCSLHVEILLVTLKAFHSECFLSTRLQCEHYYHKLHLWHAPHFATWRKKKQNPLLNILSVKTLCRHYAPYYGTTSQNSLICAVQFLSRSHIVGFSCSSFIAFCTDEADCLVCSASPISDFLGDVSNLVIISYRRTCLLRRPFLSRMEFCSTFSSIR